MMHVAARAVGRRLALDRAGSVRDYDADGRLHVSSARISKANVCPYAAEEIPDWEIHGLQRGRFYQLLRDPGELAKAARTFQHIPILSRHEPVDVNDHRPDLVVGSTGTDARFESPYLVCSLVFWSADAITAIENGAKKELSSAYRYELDPTPGTFEGQRYDGVMRNLIGNHLATVAEGRAGSDVVVQDQARGLRTPTPADYADLSRRYPHALRIKVSL